MDELPVISEFRLSPDSWCGAPVFADSTRSRAIFGWSEAGRYLISAGSISATLLKSAVVKTYPVP